MLRISKLNYDKPYVQSQANFITPQINMRSILLQFIAICSIRALENPIPSSYLQPRNFNPHPYQEDSAFLISTGHADDFQERSQQQKYEALARTFQK